MFIYENDAYIKMRHPRWGSRGHTMKIIIKQILLAYVGLLIFSGFLPGIVQSQQIKLNSFTQLHDSSNQMRGDNEKQCLVPSNLEVGDLVFFDSTAPPGRWNVRGYDHVAIYLGDGRFIGTMRNTINNAVEVNVSSYSFFFNVPHFKNPMFARVISATPEQRLNATKWALSRIGDLYQTWDPRKIADPDARVITADQWYCSELVWAAYYHQGIDIDKNGWTRDFPWFFPIWSSVSPQDIADDNDVARLS